MQIIKEITEDSPFLIVNKPAGLPSAPLSKDDKNNVFSIMAEQFPKLLEVKGRKEIEHGLLHRIDTATNGLLLIAASQACYDELIALQAEGKIKKYYTANCNIIGDNSVRLGGFPESGMQIPQVGNEIVLESYFRAYGDGRKEVRPVTEASGKAALKKLEKKVLYKTCIKVLEKSESAVKVEACIVNGYRHQVRCHLAWLGIPVNGDSLYNSKFNNEKSMDFTASKIDICGKIWYI